MADPATADPSPASDLLAELGDAVGGHGDGAAAYDSNRKIFTIAAERGLGMLPDGVIDALDGTDDATRAFREALAAATALLADGAEISQVPWHAAAGPDRPDAAASAAGAVRRVEDLLASRAGSRVTATLGSALAAAVAAGSDADVRRRALAIAACEAPGVVPVGRTPDRAYLAARHAQNGVLFARYAAAGLTAPRQALEDRRGLARAVAAATQPASGPGTTAVARAWADLGRFAVSAPWPPRRQAVEAARMTTGNALALAAAAIATEPMIATLTTSDPRGRLARLRDAATRTGAAAHIMDFDDTHLETLIHAGAPVVGAVLHAAAEVDATGDELLAAVAVGVEIAFRVGRFMGRAHIDLGWHPTATMGALGAAAGSARLLGLDAEEATRALSVAGLTAAGLLAAAGTGTKSLTAGRAAADGLEAALLAPLLRDLGDDFDLEAYRSALTGTPPRTDAPVDLLTLGLPWDPGDPWLIEENAFKPYACGILSHAVVDVGRLLREYEPERTRLGAISLHINPIVVRAMGTLEPHDELEAKFSAAHCLAMGYLDGGAGIAQFESGRVTAADARAFRALVTLVPDDAVATDAAWAEVVVDGAVRDVRVHHARGSLASPLTLADLHEKIAQLVRMACPERADELAGLLLDPAAAPTTRALLTMIGVEL